MTAREILERAKALLLKPESYCKGRHHVIVKGEVIARDLFAAMMDASMQEGYSLGTDAWEEAKQLVFAETHGHGITKYSDNADVTHAHIIATLDRAILRAS